MGRVRGGGVSLLLPPYAPDEELIARSHLFPPAHPPTRPPCHPPTLPSAHPAILTPPTSHSPSSSTPFRRPSGAATRLLAVRRSLTLRVSQDRWQFVTTASCFFITQPLAGEGYVLASKPGVPAGEGLLVVLHALSNPTHHPHTTSPQAVRHKSHAHHIPGRPVRHKPHTTSPHDQPASCATSSGRSFCRCWAGRVGRSWTTHHIRWSTRTRVRPAFLTLSPGWDAWRTTALTSQSTGGSKTPHGGLSIATAGANTSTGRFGSGP